MRFSNQVKQSVLTSNRKGDCRHKIPCETYEDREMNIIVKTNKHIYCITRTNIKKIFRITRTNTKKIFSMTRHNIKKEEIENNYLLSIAWELLLTVFNR